MANERIYDMVMHCESADVLAEIPELVLTEGKTVQTSTH